MCKRVLYVYLCLHACVHLYLFVCLFTFYDYYSHRETITQQSCPFCDSRTTFSPPYPSLLALFPLISLLKAENLKTNALLQHTFLHNSLHYSKCLFYVCELHTNTQRETLSLSFSYSFAVTFVMLLISIPLFPFWQSLRPLTVALYCCLL